MDVRVGLGQDTHQFVEEGNTKALVMGGVTYPTERGLIGNSDADVILHAISRAIDSIIGKNYLGPYSDQLCQEQGISDSREYLKPALNDLKEMGFSITNVSIALECLKPKILSKIPAIKESVAQCLVIETSRIGVTVESGEGLTEMAQGKGIRCLTIVTVVKE